MITRNLIINDDACSVRNNIIIENMTFQTKLGHVLCVFDVISVHVPIHVYVYMYIYNIYIYI